MRHLPTSKSVVLACIGAGFFVAFVTSYLVSYVITRDRGIAVGAALLIGVVFGPLVGALFAPANPGFRYVLRLRRRLRRGAA